MTAPVVAPSDRVGPIFDRLLDDAGLPRDPAHRARPEPPPLRILDVGCGHGAVSALLARRAGPRGEIVAIDRDPEVLAVARARPAEPDAAPITFVQTDVMTPPEGPFDAIVGRRVLMYLPDRVAALRALVRELKPGGIVAFQEVDFTGLPSLAPAFPEHARCVAWLREMVRREGATTAMGYELPGALRAAGLQIRDVRAELVVQTAEQRQILAAVIAAVLPRIVGRGVATAAEIDVDTLEDRLAAEIAATDLPYVGDQLWGAWAEKSP